MRKISIILGLALALVCATEAQAHHAGFAHLTHANGLHRNNSLHHNNLAQFRHQQFLQQQLLLQQQNFGGYTGSGFSFNAGAGGCMPPLPVLPPVPTANFSAFSGVGVNPFLQLNFGRHFHR